MSKFTMCTGEGCLLKEVCHRFKADKDPNQDYFKPPIKAHWNNEGLTAGRNFICHEFWVLSDNHRKWVILSDRLKEEDKVALSLGRRL